MRVTIDTFKQCLKRPRECFMTLETDTVTHIVRKVECDENGEPIVFRTANFAAATVAREIGGRRFHLFLPLSDDVLKTCQRSEAIMSQVNSELFCEHRILRNELRYQSWDGSTKYVDILLCSIPTGVPLTEYVTFEENDFSFLAGAVDAVEAELAKFKLSYNGISPRNIIVGEDKRLYLTRLHTVKQGDDQAEQRVKEMNMLREWITKQLALNGCDFECSESEGVNSYGCKDTIFKHHKRVSNPFEGIISVEDEDGFRYVDLYDSPIFDTVFKWAGDFQEGRAEVELPTGMGLIDKRCKYIIPAEFDIVEYDIESGFSRVKKDDMWALYDYNGDQILPFESRYIDDEDIKLIHIK